MSDFDPIKAQREITTGTIGILNVIRTSAREAERKLAEAEAESSALRKLEQFAQEIARTEQGKLNALVAEQEAASAPTGKGGET